MVRTRRQIKIEKPSTKKEDEASIKIEDANNDLFSEEETSRHNIQMKSSPSPDTKVGSNNDASSSFMFQGKAYDSYEEMVKAKRKRNTDFLKSSGLLEASTKMKDNIYGADVKKKTEASQRGLRADRKRKAAPQITTRRTSNRLAGVKSDGAYVEDDRAGKFVIGGVSDELKVLGGGGSSRIEVIKEKERFFNNRINDGSSISLKEAVQFAGSKWVKENSVPQAEHFISELKDHNFKDEKPNSPRSTASAMTKSHSLTSQVAGLSLDSENHVAKVVPDKIYSVAFHPSPHKLIVAAGDKNGHLGLWDVDASSEDNERNGVHLFKPYNSVISNLEWDKSGSKLFSSSYDGSMRVFDVQKETFSEIFATYDSSSEYKGKLGFGLNDGWMQYSCIDHRNHDCIFYSNSFGDVIHIDMRQKSKITFNANLSQKKINTISLHPTGNALATAGLDCTVNIWDIRKMKSSKSSPIASQYSTKSINSAFFSPSGKHLLTTTMSDTLDIISDAHLVEGRIEKPTHRIRHNNRTGRWLATFMAQWHPSSSSGDDLFVVGSMQQPRTLQIFDANEGELLRDLRGDALTSVVSRCCFHPSTSKLIAAGGNSSGRVTIAR